MISICIPIFNWQVYNLSVSLVEQCEAAQIPFEVIFIDDASNSDFKKYNASLSDISHVTYIQLYKNVGRAVIRNLFLKFAKYEYLLFLDCDSELPDNQFINRYFQGMKQNYEVICGGRLYFQKPANKLQHLRWNYGKERECKSAFVRNKKPSYSFLSNNFLIKKEIFEKINFDERLRNYGHEDTLFGYQLKKANIQVTHIDNPTIHTNIEDADLFLEKTRNAIENLFFIYKEIKPGNDFKETVKLLNSFVLIRNFHLDKFFALLFCILKPAFYFLFIKKGYSGLKLFDLYKLTWLCFYSNFAYKKGRSLNQTI
jgi:glycosyltransferase involved in cell wall biosynthesis